LSPVSLPARSLIRPFIFAATVMVLTTLTLPAMPERHRYSP
jgi:hypothetical protein